MSKLFSRFFIACTLLCCAVPSAQAEWIGKNQSFSPINTHIPDPIPPQERGSVAENLTKYSYPLRIHNIPRTGYSSKLPEIKYDIYKVFDPTLAKSVEVMGYVQSSDSIKIFYRTATGKNAAIASVGDTIVDGRVLVKRLETSPGRSPIFILEEDGLEVTRAIGEISSDNPK